MCYAVLSLAAGAVWGGIAVLFAPQWPTTRLMFQQAALVAPVIGLIIGVAFRWIHRVSPVGRVFASLLSLYIAAALFGLAVGVADALRNSPSAGGRNLTEVILQSVPATLWGLTFTGLVLLLWPLAYLTHSLVGRAAGAAGLPPHRR